MNPEKPLTRWWGVVVLSLFLPATVPAQNVWYSFFDDFDACSGGNVMSVSDAGWQKWSPTGGQEWECCALGGSLGGGCLRIVNKMAGPADDWLFSRALSFDSATSCQLSFDCRVTTSGLPQMLEVYVDTTTPTMTNLLFPVLVDNRSIQTHTIPFTVPVSGDYYIGFRCMSPPGTLGLFLDSVRVAEPEARLQVTLEMDKAFYEEGASSYAADEPIKCTVYLANVGTEPLVVNKRMAIGHESLPEGVLAFRISDPDSQPVLPRAKFECAPPEAEDNYYLEPGKRIYKDYDLNLGIYAFTKTGNYSIQAVYTNVYTFGNTWRGKLVSDPVTITIAP